MKFIYNLQNFLKLYMHVCMWEWAHEYNAFRGRGTRSPGAAVRGIVSLVPWMLVSKAGFPQKAAGSTFNHCHLSSPKVFLMYFT